MSEELPKSANKDIFWGANPNTLLDPEHVWEIFPVSNMSFEHKLNAVSRLVFILVFLFYLFLQSFRVVIIGVLTLISIWLIHFSRVSSKKEGFDPADDYIKMNKIPEDIFATPSETNPLQNVMISDYDSPSEKKPARAAYTKEASDNILIQTKKMINEINPEQPQISDKLYKSLGDNLEFEQSMRPFFSNPSTTIPNDENAFADFCYGGMVSCKEGNPFACVRNLARHVN